MPRAASDSTTKTATRKANTKTAKEPKTKAKRAPSAYNLFMAEHLKKWKEEHPESPIKEGMAAVAAMWKNAPENPKRGQEPAAKKPKADKKSKKEVVKSDASEEENDGGDD